MKTTLGIVVFILLWILLSIPPFFIYFFFAKILDRKKKERFNSLPENTSKEDLVKLFIEEPISKTIFKKENIGYIILFFFLVVIVEAVFLISFVLLFQVALDKWL